MPLYPFKCDACERSWEEFQHINDKHESKCCGKILERTYNSDYVPFTHKDRMYEFTKEDKNGNVHEIRSSKQYDNFLKSNGIVNITKDDRRNARKSDAWHEKRAADKRALSTKKIKERCHKEGLSDALKTMAKT